MQSALPIQNTQGTPVELATQQDPGIVVLATIDKLAEAIAEFQKATIDYTKVDIAERSEGVTNAVLVKSFDLLLNNAILVRSLWTFTQGVKLPILNKYLSTDGLGSVYGRDRIPFSDIDNAPFILENINPVGTFLITAGSASYPVANPVGAIGATQTGSGSGSGGSIAAGDAWLLSGNTLLDQTIGPDNFLITSEKAYIVAIKDSPTNSDDDWVVIEEEVDENTDLTALQNSVTLLQARVAVLEGSAAAPTYVLTRSATNINEGSAVTITLITTNVANGTNVPYTIVGIQLADLSSGVLTGNFVVTSNSASLVIALANDLTTEGVENLTVNLDNGQATISVTINDTSITPNNPTYALQRNAASVNEGGSIVITLNTTGIADNTNVGYTITGVQSADIGGASLAGTFTVINNTASVTLPVTNDLATEGAETLTLTLNNSAASISVLINDTSIPTNNALPYTLPFNLP